MILGNHKFFKIITAIDIVFGFASLAISSVLLGTTLLDFQDGSNVQLCHASKGLHTKLHWNSKIPDFGRKRDRWAIGTCSREWIISLQQKNYKSLNEIICSCRIGRFSAISLLFGCAAVQFICGTSFLKLLRVEKVPCGVKRWTISGILHVFCLIFSSLAFVLSFAYGMEKTESQFRKEWHQIFKTDAPGVNVLPSFSKPDLNVQGILFVVCCGINLAFCTVVVILYLFYFSGRCQNLLDEGELEDKETVVTKCRSSQVTLQNETNNENEISESDAKDNLSSDQLQS